VSRHTTFLVCYDIADPKRLREVHRVVSGHGQRIQYSVYRCALTAAQRVRLKAKLGRLIHEKEDQVLFVEIGPTGGRQVLLETMGLALPEERAPGRILIG